MTDTPALPLHHVIEQQAAKDSALLKALAVMSDPATGRALFEVEAPQKLLNPPYRSSY
ncbi:hypothetical protein KDX01_09515 [Burkholderia vietnamiensis]|nr:hypothetical protein [Burkholderia vietnamiensis]